MNIHRMIQGLLFVSGLLFGLVVGNLGSRAAILSNFLVFGKKVPPWRSPDSEQLLFDDVSFVSNDGVLLRGWFIRSSRAETRPAPAIVLVHSWGWSRVGYLSQSSPLPGATVDLLRVARMLHDSGMHVLLFDLRNHGSSQVHAPVTFGVHESRDVIAAINWLQEQPEVDNERLGAIGFSMGANALMYALPYCQPVKAAVAIQPVRVATYAPALAREMIGPIGPALLELVSLAHPLLDAPQLKSADPTPLAKLITETHMLYIQGDGDYEGNLWAIQEIVEQTPSAELLVIPSRDRFDTYHWLDEHPETFQLFFERNLLW